jgi:threonine dehydratase
MREFINQESFEIELSDIQKARDELKNYIEPTPLVYSQWLSELFDCKIYLKLENMQPIGSFKIRGATYKISSLSKEEKKRGVIAASAGNHAQGVAWGSRQLNVNSLIVMPVNAPLVKIQNTKALGADILLEGDYYDEACVIAQKMSEKTGRVFVHAFEDKHVIAGQGTIGLELIEQIPQADFVIGPIGGGGLMAGIATVYKSLMPKTILVGCQAVGASSMIDSIKMKKAVRSKSAATFADGVAIAQASEKMRKLLNHRIDEWVEVDEDSIAASVLALLEKAKTLTEGAGALPLAALKPLKGKIKNKKVVLILSGGNIDVNVLSRVIDLGLIRTGRRLRLNVLVYDRPGSLASLTGLIAKQGANVLQAIHDRNEPFTKLEETEVALTLETRGPEHSASIIEALKSHVLRLELAH